MSRNPYRPIPESSAASRAVLTAYDWRTGHLPPSTVHRLRWAARAACRRLRGERDEARLEAATWKDRCEASFEDVESLNRLNEMWHGRATRAEAAIERVREMLAQNPSPLLHEDIVRRALDGAP
jgi:hypothetical protein